MMNIEEILVIFLIALVVLGPTALIKALTKITAMIVIFKNYIHKIKSNNTELNNIIAELEILKNSIKYNHNTYSTINQITDMNSDTLLIDDQPELEFQLKQPELFDHE